MIEKINENLKITKFIPVEREKVFKYFVQPELLEKWSYPDGMTLKVPSLEPRINGKYRFEHTAKEGKYTCDGYFKDFILNEKLIQVDTVRLPDNNLLFENLEAVTHFKALQGGTEITIVQSGFPDEESLRSCEESWHQCLSNLTNLLTGGMGTRPDTTTSERNFYDSHQ